MKDVEMVEEEKLKVMHDKDESNFNCTYSFNGEDHTLGNLLRCVLMKDGYSVPHPSEEVMNVRLQTNTITTDKALRKAFSRISKITEILTDKYSTALNEHDKHQQ